MTCIVGIVENGTVYIGGDSYASTGSFVRALKNPKIFQTGPFVIGCTGSIRMSQLLEYSLEIEDQEQDMPDEEYMVRVFIEAVRSCLKEYGYLEVDNNREVIGTFLVGYRGGLYRAASDLQIIQLLDGMAACGCGQRFALAAMYALQGLGYGAEERITRALEVSAYFDGNVAPPFAVLHT